MREQGGLTLREEGVLVALDGKTNLEEILRVTQNDDDELQASKHAPQHAVEHVASKPRKEAA
jgi:hypothetical protein